MALADCGYGNCTHQNHQEGKWRPVKRGTGCGANGDERQGLRVGTFVGNPVGYTRSASEDHEQKSIDAGRPNLFVRNPVPSKKEWDAVQALHPKLLLCSVPCAAGLSASDTAAFAELMADLTFAGGPHDPLYLQIQKFHRAKLADHLAAGKAEKDFKCRIIKRLLDKIIMPANWLMYRLDPNGKRSVTEVHTALQPYFRDYQAFMRQHETGTAFAARVARWDLEEYLDVMDTAVVVTRIDTKKEELWGDLYFKCSCKPCFVRGCCRESVIWSMVLNPKLVIPPKYAKLEPGERKRKGRPTEKRVAKLKEAQADLDARPFVDKAAPRVSSTHPLHSI